MPIVPTAPTLPQLWIATNTVPYGHTGSADFTPANGAQFQAALNSAALGQIIELTAGVTYAGTFLLPAKSTGTGWVVIRSSAFASLPGPNVRITPAQASLMPKIDMQQVPVADSSPAFRCANGTGGNVSHHYWFEGIEITGTSQPPNGFYGYMADLNGRYDASGNDTIVIDNDNKIPHHFTFNHCYIHGGPYTLRVAGWFAGLLIHANYTAVVDSHVSGFTEASGDPGESKGISPQACHGPIKIVNNYVEAAGENIFLGYDFGTDVSLALMPSDIEVRKNYVTKPLAWNPKDPAYALGTTTTTADFIGPGPGTLNVVSTSLFSAGGGAGYLRGLAFNYTSANATQFLGVTGVPDLSSGVSPAGSVVAPYPAPLTKNLMESKGSSRVLIEGNVFENHWSGAQPGIFITFTPRLAVGHNTFMRIDDLTVRHNRAKSVSSGGSIAAYDGESGIGDRMHRVLIYNNLWEGIGRWPQFGDSNGWPQAIQGAPHDVDIRHNTWVAQYNGSVIKFLGGAASLILPAVTRFDDNLCIPATSNFIQGEFANGAAALDGYCQAGSWELVNNVWAIDMQNGYGGEIPNNFHPLTIAAVGFVNYAAGDADYHNYALTSGSTFHNAATDGRDVGVIMADLDAAFALDNDFYAGGAAPPAAPTGLHLIP